MLLFSLLAMALGLGLLIPTIRSFLTQRLPQLESISENRLFLVLLALLLGYTIFGNFNENRTLKNINETPPSSISKALNVGSNPNLNADRPEEFSDNPHRVKTIKVLPDGTLRRDATEPTQQSNANPLPEPNQQRCRMVYFESLGLLQEAEKLCRKEFFKTPEGRHLKDLTSGCTNFGEVYMQSSIERGHQVFRIMMRDNGKDGACNFANKTLAINANANEQNTEAWDVSKKNDVVFLDLLDTATYEGRWCDTKENCQNDDSDSCVAIGRWRRIGGQLKFGSGRESFGGYEVGCSLRNKNVVGNVIHFDGICEGESEKYKANVIYRFLSRDKLVIENASGNNDPVVRCP